VDQRGRVESCTAFLRAPTRHSIPEVGERRFVPDRRVAVFLSMNPHGEAPMQFPASDACAKTRPRNLARVRASRFEGFCVAALLCAGMPAAAATFSVGPGATCTHNTLQAALDSAANNSGADVVRIVRTATWNAIQVSTQTDQDVEIVGGWTACTSQTPTGRTILSGVGGQARSVIALRGNANFTLRNLEITGGDQAGDDDGGGIHFQGGGILRVIDSLITGNSADEGGGIYAHGTTNLSEAILENTAVTFNTARNHGGGAVAQGIEMTLRGVDTALLFNTAGGSGGGLLVRSGDRPSYAYVSGGLFGVQSNSAARGGGIAVHTGAEELDAEVQVFSTDGNSLLIANNTASVRGGAIDVQPNFSTGLGGFPGSGTTARALLRNVDIRYNLAPVGAAINLSHVNYGPFGSQAMGGGLYFSPHETSYPVHPSAAPCPVGRPCGYIRDNTTGNITGAVMQLSENARFEASKIVLQDNEGGWLFYLSGEETTRIYLNNSVLAGNTVQNALIRDDQNGEGGNARVDLQYLTIAGNTIGANGVLSINEDMVFTRSVIDQPGKALIATNVGATGGTYDIQHVILNTTTAPGGTTLAAPRFVDAANGDYLPRAGSRAVDFAPPLESFTEDLHSRARTIDLPVNPNEIGASDVGALERMSLQPLVLNNAFDRDLNHWEALATSEWDATQNVDGPAGSGSVRGGIAADATRVAVRRQCIHLPGPARYALNGWGRVTGVAPFAPPNRVWLDWELRYSTATIDGCTNSTPGVTGSLLLASGSTWARPTTPAIIDVAPGVWGPYTTLTVYLVVQNGSPIAPGPSGTGPNAALGGPDGWFDGITLETNYDDTIFANGFEP
jgi:hypothetical protein